MKSWKLVLLLACSFGSLAAYAADGSSLKPPAGANVAVVIFEDLECPSCAQAWPMVENASAKYKVPVVVHDVPLRYHPWAWDAAITARYIEQKYGRSVSDKFRDYIYRCQPQITKGNLQSYTDKFCGENKIALPFALDPQGKIADGIRADLDLATKVQLGETPTIFVVSANRWTQVADYRTQLYGAVEQMKLEAAPAPAPVTPRRHTTKR
jgi:protein-disulfide isomerase